MPIVLKQGVSAPSPAAGRYAVDTFVRPALADNMDSARRYAQLAEGLSQFEAGFAKWRDVRFRQFTEEELAKSRQEWEATRKPWADYVREHPEAAGFSPWFRRGYMELSARNEAEQLSRDILTELERNPEVSYTDDAGHQVTTHVNDTDSPEALEAFLAGRMEDISARFRESDPLIHAAAVAPVLEQTRAAAHDYQRKARARAYEEGMEREFDTRFNILLDNGEAATERLVSFMAEFHDLGMTDEQANELLLKAAAGSSMRSLGFAALDAVADIPVQGGLMRQSTAWRDARARVSRAITAENRSRLAAEASMRRARMEEQEALFKAAALDMRLRGEGDPVSALAAVEKENGKPLDPVGKALFLESFYKMKDWADYAPVQTEADERDFAEWEVKASMGLLTSEELIEACDRNPVRGAELAKSNGKRVEELGRVIPDAVRAFESRQRRELGLPEELAYDPVAENNARIITAKAAASLFYNFLEQTAAEKGSALTESEVRQLEFRFGREVLPRYREFALDADIRADSFPLANDEKKDSPPQEAPVPALPSILDDARKLPGWVDPGTWLPQPRKLDPPEFRSPADFTEQVKLWSDGQPCELGRWQSLSGASDEEVALMLEEVEPLYTQKEEQQ